MTSRAGVAGMSVPRASSAQCRMQFRLGVPNSGLHLHESTLTVFPDKEAHLAHARHFVVGQSKGF